MLSLHIIALLCAGMIILFADKEAFSWVRGKKDILDATRMHRFHLAMWAALLALVATGAIMAYPRLSYLTSQPLFLIKMSFVGILFVNAVIIGRLMPVASIKSFASLPQETKRALYLSGVVSTFSWIGTVLVALALFS